MLRRDFDPDEPPAYGQVWEWEPAARSIAPSPFVLIRPKRDDAATWEVYWLRAGWINTMTGLWDDPKYRLKGYRRLA